MLRTLARPFVETPPSPALCGFLLTGQDGMRLCIVVEEADGLVEEERWTVDETDPHRVRAVDLTTW
ncbi:hypothetical protein [Streptomyces sp. NPDC047985]|uniref:hypothetical protein n=1 Tax=unclassified Streptomyces TaxID=2593676 RepID=UPI00341BAC4E